MKEKARNLMSNYKKFALKGNLLDLAIAVVIGNAFGKIVNSLVKDIIMPLLSLAIGNVNYSDLKYVFSPQTDTRAEVALMYGNFIQMVVEFIIISFSIFLVFSFLNRVKKKEETVAPATPKKGEEVLLLEEIRDLLKKEG